MREFVDINIVNKKEDNKQETKLDDNNNKNEKEKS